MEIPMTPSVGIIIYQSRLKIHRPIWGWLGWGVESGVKEFEVIAAAGHPTRSCRADTPFDFAQGRLCPLHLRLLLVLLFSGAVKIRTNTKIKSGGQECPPYTWACFFQGLEDQNQHQDQERRTGVSALHSQHPRHPWPSGLKPVS
jgi:hypothetical protein